ncbi:type IV pilus modification PilV family protein [Ureibacillus sp. MALMAid1270]|uniref:type IV pilus modification PilV family protein n=1 Tax=Ureibacillus sp. MALMAid1270 TaxID=3411629 RepID=UPI003BA4D406
MRRFKNNKILDESGLSLIEVIASVVILTIILLGIFGLFVQSAKTTKNSEKIVDATYIAQTEMENLYLQTKKSCEIEDVMIRCYPISNYVKAIHDLGYTNIDDSGYPLGYFKKYISNSNFYVKLTVKTPVNGVDYLTRVIIYVIEVGNSGEVIKAQMENTIQWSSL